MEAKTLSKAVKATRRAKNVTLARVAKAVGKSRAYVAAALAGNHRLTPHEAKKAV